MFVDDGNESLSNVTIEAMLLERLGPRSKDVGSGVVLTFVYGMIFISGCLGNIFTCLVVSCNPSMQTTTNYYLFSLALSDLMLIFFGLPPELFSIWSAYPWQFGEVFCYLRSTMLEFTSYASVLTITAFTIERYIAICRPLLSHKIVGLSRTLRIIICIWTMSMLASLPYAAHTRLYYAVTCPESKTPISESLVCSIPEKWLEGRMTYIFQISTFLFFVTPVVLISCLYILIGLAISRSQLSRAATNDLHSQSNIGQSGSSHHPRRVVIKMLAAVTIAFIICWAPFHIQRLMVLYVHTWTPKLLAAQSHIFYISGVLYFVSSTVNPILYNVISRRYRNVFKRTVFGRCLNHRNSDNTFAISQCGSLQQKRSSYANYSIAKQKKNANCVDVKTWKPSPKRHINNK